MLVDELVNGGEKWRRRGRSPPLQELDKLFNGLLLFRRQRTDYFRKVLNGHGCLPFAVYLFGTASTYLPDPFAESSGH